MKNRTVCKCDGMNEECMFCDGAGYVPLAGYELIKVEVNSLDSEREDEKLKNYNKSSWNKSERKRVKKVYQKKKDTAIIRTFVAIRDEDYLNYIGPSNPNRQKQQAIVRSIKPCRKRNDESA